MFSPQTIEALAQVISGGAGNDDRKPIGIYRSGPKIEQFMRNCGVDMRIGAGSRLPVLTNWLIELNRNGDDKALRLAFEYAADPRDFVREPEKHVAVMRHLNTYLVPDGFELQLQGGRARLCKSGATSSVVTALDDAARTLDLDTVRTDLDRALKNADTDPEDAVTAANSTLESVCRSILIELGKDLPEKRDITGLMKAIREPLGLTGDQASKEISDDVQKILGSLAGVSQGVGALRTHAGDAHGRERKFRRIDARIARLAINSAGSAALFLIETWQQKYPAKALTEH